MSLGSNFMASITSKDALLLYKFPFQKTPILIAGSGINDIINFDDEGEVKVLKYDTTADGATVTGIKPVVVSGYLKLLWLSPARVRLSAIQKAQYVSGLVVPGQELIIVVPSGQWGVRFPNFALSSVPTAPNLTKDGVGEVKVSFNCQVPIDLPLGTVTTLLSSLGNLV